MKNYILYTAMLSLLVLIPSQFMYAAPTLTITAPTSNVTVGTGETLNIAWNSTNVDKVSIFYKTCPSCTQEIVSGLTNTGHYSWVVDIGSLKAGTYAIQIQVIAYQTGVGSVSVVSDSFNVTVGDGGDGTTTDHFTPPETDTSTEQSKGSYSISLTSPNGGQVWTPGNTYTVTWTQTGLDRVTVYLQRYGSDLKYASEAATLGRVDTSRVDTSGSLSIQVSEKAIEANTYKIKVRGAQIGTGAVEDISDTTLTVKYQGTTLPSTPQSGVATPRTKWAKDITSTSARLTGSVNPNGNVDTYAWFMVSTALPNKTVPSTPYVLLPAKDAIIDQEAVVTGLMPNTSYSYQMVAQIRGFRYLGVAHGFTTKGAEDSAQDKEAEVVIDGEHNETVSGQKEEGGLINADNTAAIEQSWAHVLTPLGTQRTPDGYGDPYFEYRGIQSMLMRTWAPSETIFLTAGSGSTFQKIAREGRFMVNGVWHALNWNGISPLDADGYYTGRVYYMLRPGDPLYTTEASYAAHIRMTLPGCDSASCRVDGWRLQQYSLK